MKLTSALISLLIFLFAAFSVAAETTGEYYEDARQRYEENDIPGALIQLKNALQSDSQHLPSLVLAGEIYLDNNEPAAAEEVLSDALLLGADNTSIILKLADAFLRQGKYLSVIHDLPVDHFEGDARVTLLANRAEAYMGIGKLTLAQQALDEADSLRPRALISGVTRVSLLLQRKNLAGAQQLSEQLLDLYPHDYRTWDASASVFHAQGRGSEAQSYYAKALELNPDNVNVRVARAGLLLDLQKNEEAATELAYLEKNFPLEPRAAYLRGVAYERAGNAEASHAALQKCANLVSALPLEVVSRSKQLSMAVSLAHYSLGEFERANHYISQYLRLNPGDIGASRLQASVLIGLKETNEAIKFLRPLLRQFPDDPQLISMMASAYSQLGQHHRSVELLEKLRDKTGDNPELDIRLAMSLLNSGQSAPAIDRMAILFTENPSRIDLGFTLTFAYLRAGEFDAALAVANRLVESDKTNVSYLNLLGMTQYHSGNLEEASDTFVSLLQAEPNFHPSRLNLARVRIAQGSFVEARKSLEKMLVDTPANGNVMLEQARLEQIEGNPDEARRWAKNAVEALDDELEPRIFLLELYLKQGDLEAAERLARDTVSVFDESLESTTLQGQVLARVGKLDDAKFIYGRMSKEVGFDSDALYKIALLQLELKDYRAAQHSLYKALQSNPDHLPATVAIVDTYLALQEYDTAIELAQESKKRFPGQAEWDALSGAAFFRKGDAASAEAAYRRATVLSNSSAYILGLYRALLAEDKRSAAEQVLVSGLEEFPDDVVLQVALSEFLLGEGRWKEGEEVLSSLLATRQEHPQLLNNMANVKHQLGRADAMDYAQRALAADSTDPMINDTVGWFLVLDGKAEEGLVYLREAITRSSGDPELQYHLAVALHNVGRSSEAKRALNIALAEERTGAWYKEAKDLAESLQ